jgi:hypothetical protein
MLQEAKVASRVSQAIAAALQGVYNLPSAREKSR